MSGLRMRPRVGQPSRYVPPPSIPPYEPPAPPIFGWTINARLSKTARYGGQKDFLGNPVEYRVYAPTEAEAHAKVLAAIKPIPIKETERYRDICYELTTVSMNEVQP